MERLQLLVERDTSTRIPVDVFAFERPILEAIHGPESVHELGSTTTDDPFDAEAAHDRLRTKYGDVALHVYPSVRALGQAVQGGEPAKPKARK